MRKFDWKKLIVILVLALVVAGGVLGGERKEIMATEATKPDLTPIWAPNEGDIPHSSSPTAIKEEAKKEETPTSDKITNILSWIVYHVAWFFSLLVGLLVEVLVKVANYNNFLNMRVVNAGWSIVRDICNNFFIIMLLVISVGTILNLKSYSYKQLLPKLLIVAVLINFSKLFTGILIDFSQVFMITFASALTGNNLILMALGLDKLYEGGKDFTAQAQAEDFNVGIGDALIALIFALIVSVVAAVVILIIIVILLYRIVMLWFLIILSPAAYLLSAWPQGKGYSDEWWKELTKYLITGPVMLFFVYLAFYSGQVGFNNGKIDVGQKGLSGESEITFTEVEGAGLKGLSEMMSPEGIFNLMIVLGLLVGSLVMGQKIGGAGASWAGTGLGFLKKAGKGTALWTGKKVGGAALGGAKFGLAGMGALGKAVGGKWGERVARGGVGVGAGALAGAMVAGPVGAAVGAGAVAAAKGLTIGFRGLKNRMNNRRQQQNNLLAASAQPDKGATYKGYTWDDAKGTYVNTAGDVLKDANGNIENRWGDYKDTEGNVYRRRSEGDRRYYKVDSKGEFVDKTGKVAGSSKDFVAAKGVFGGSIKAMGGFHQDLWAAWASTRNKSWQAKDVAENEAIEKEQKNFEGMSSDVLNRLLDMETNSRRKMAIALTLAIKGGFKEAKQVNKAKDALAGNSVLLKSFNEKMNKKDMILNNTRKDGTLNEDAIKRLVADGGAKWSEQKTAQLTGEALTVMADQLGTKFHSTLEDMMSTAKDKSNVQTALEQNIKARGMTGADLNIRKSAAAVSGNWIDSFRDSTGAVKHTEMQEAMKKVSKAKVFASASDADLADEDFKVNMASSLSIKAFNQMYRSDDVDPAKLKKYCEAVESVASMAGPGTTGTGRPISQAEIDAARSLLTQIRSTPGLGSFAP